MQPGGAGEGPRPVWENSPDVPKRGSGRVPAQGLREDIRRARKSRVGLERFGSDCVQHAVARRSGLLDCTHWGFGQIDFMRPFGPAVRASHSGGGDDGDVTDVTIALPMINLY